MKKEHIDRIKEGFRWVFQEGDGTGVKYFKNAPYKPAGKTGTAQTVYGGDDPIGRNAKRRTYGMLQLNVSWICSI